MPKEVATGGRKERAHLRGLGSSRTSRRGWRAVPTRDDRDGGSEMRWQRVGKARWCFRGTVRMGAFEGCASEAL